MKKLLLTLICFILLFALQAQVLYGTAANGGANGIGTISRYNSIANTLTAAFTFEAPDGVHPQFSNLVQASNGKLYGMTNGGGSNNYGTLFCYDPATSTYMLLKNFDIASGIYPYGSLMQAADGKLYGMTTYGGINNAGVIFCFDPATAVYTKVKDLDIANGAWPYGNLMQASDGKLYGMTSYGGSRNNGVIFCFDPVTLTYTKKYDLDGGSGGSPYGSLMQAADGKLYGMTTYGGSKGYGVIFSFDLVTSTYTRLKNFNTADGGYPYGRLTQAADGKLYGMTSVGGYRDDGIIFSFDPVTAIYNILRDMEAGSGDNPYGSLMPSADGKLYGVTSNGGSNNAGVIFCINPTTATYIRLKDLDDANGSNPQGNLVLATNGKFYSMTTNGGVGDKGVIFSFDPNVSVYSKLKDFGSNQFGSNAMAGVIKNTGGKLYGMTNAGGRNGVGLIYCFNPATSQYTSVYNFDGANGSNPKGSLMQAAGGKLYGMTYSGGNGYGVIFSFDTATAVYTKLYTFDYTNGSNPIGNLLQAANGKLYGMTTYGGINGAGVLFSFNPATLQYTKIVDFNNTNGAYPTGSLMQASDGKLYGMTTYGGSKGYGVIFSLDPNTSVFTKLKEFVGTNGNNPTGNLIQATDGKLYGMTNFGGSTNNGVIFSLITSNLTVTVRKSFSGTDGSAPYGSLMQAADTKLYGVTAMGGSNNAGVVFSFAPAKSSYIQLQDFNGTNGSNPQYVALTETACTNIYYRDADGDGFGNANISVQNCTPPAGYVSNNTDCNDSNAIEKPDQVWYIDVDRDGYSGSIIVQCTRPANGFLPAELTGTGDCNDSIANIHPNATEIPDDGIDQNCDGADLKTWYADADADGFGNANVTTTANTQPSGYVADKTDCNDGDAGIHAPVTYYADNDNDGFGSTANTIQACTFTPPAGFVANTTDCNDADNTIYPGAPELCDGKDNNCDGTTDEGCAVPKIRINDVSLTEGNSGTQNMIFTVTLTAAPLQTVTVSYQTKNVTAVAPSDYVAQTGTLTFAPGVKQQTIAITINGDVTVEADETFKVVLSNPVNATWGDNTGIGTIINDDVAGKASTLLLKRKQETSNYLVNIAPNPARSTFTVQLKGFSGNITLQLMDLEGKILTTAKLHGVIQEYAQQQFDVSAIANGTYFLTVQDEKGHKQFEKVVVSH